VQLALVSVAVVEGEMAQDGAVVGVDDQMVAVDEDG
jgi:hypothetical protein